MISSKKLLADLESKKTSRTTMVKRLEDDLRARCDADPAVDAPLKAQYEAAKKKKRTALTYKAWREEELTQIAVAWVLGCVFVRFLEDNELVETPKLSGPGARLQRARDEHDMYFRRQPQDDTDRGYLIEIFEETGRLPGMREFFDKKHNPLWLAAPSGDACRELLQFWQKTDPATGALIHDFTLAAGEDLKSEISNLKLPDTRFLGDLYQDLSEAARKQYALLQTPDFVEEFILDRTLTPAIQTFGYRVVRLIDPTCGSGHFLLGTFARLFRIWQDECPGENPRVLAQRALDGVYGVDLNPFAVAIARFRLLLAALQACGTKRLKDAPDFQIHLAVGDSLIHGARFDSEGKPYTVTRDDMFGGDEAAFKDEMAFFFDTEDSAGLHRILGQQYHAVVGNPPYITVKDKALNLLYRDRYDSCHRKYSLSVPFMERFFDLALRGSGDGREPAGFTGQITGNAFMKREFGKNLITEYIPRWDLTHVIDTSGAYIPGHGTPTVILFGRNAKPGSATVRTLMGIKGEPSTPKDPAKGKVWSAIVEKIDHLDTESDFVSGEDLERDILACHPWILSKLARQLNEQFPTKFVNWVQIVRKKPVIGFGCVMGEDEAFTRDTLSNSRSRLPLSDRREVVEGELVRDWVIEPESEAIFPYDSSIEIGLSDETTNELWPLRSLLWNRVVFGGETYRQKGKSFAAYHQIPIDRNQTKMLMVFAAVATQAQFALNRTGRVFKQSAPVIKFKSKYNESDYLQILGFLNSATACFWMKQVFHCKGSTVDQHGARQTTVPFEDFYDHDGTKLTQFPIPTGSSLVLARELDRLAGKLSEHSPDAFTARDAVSTVNLAEAEQAAAELRALMISLQEELDWQCYRHYGLIDIGDDLELPKDRLDDLPPLTLGERAFEIRMARQMADGEFETTWFERHKDAGSKPITELPAHWPDDYRALVERRLAFIESNKNINLIERPEYKRRWNTEPWAKRQQLALKKWLLARLEGYFFEGSRVCDLNKPAPADTSSSTIHDPKSSFPNLQSQIPNPFSPAVHGFTAATRPHLQTANQLADAVQSDTRFLEAAEVYVGSSGFSVAKLVRELVDAESVPFLPVHRYKDSGLRKRRDWEETWELQRLEDAVEAETRGQNRAERDRREQSDCPEGERAGARINPESREEEIKKRVRKAQLERVGEIPVPPKYGNPDFAKATYWKLRGKLDVPKERWISYPGAERAGDDSLLIAWAGWDHLQQAQALAEYFIDARDNQAFPPARLKPLLAGLADLIPWLQQWHNTVDPDLGMGLGDYFASFLEEQCRLLGTTIPKVDARRFASQSETPSIPWKGAGASRVPVSPGGEEAVVVAAAEDRWQDRAFALLASKRKKLTDYRMLVWPELLRQMSGDMEFETFRKAYWLLSEPAELEKIGRRAFPDVPGSWWQSRTETLAKDEFLVTLKGSVILGDVRIWREDDVRFVRWTRTVGVSNFPEAVDDARIALQLATLWSDNEPDAVRDSLEEELVLLETP